MLPEYIESFIWSMQQHNDMEFRCFISSKSRNHKVTLEWRPVQLGHSAVSPVHVNNNFKDHQAYTNQGSGYKHYTSQQRRNYRRSNEWKQYKSRNNTPHDKPRTPCSNNNQVSDNFMLLEDSGIFNTPAAAQFDNDSKLKHYTENNLDEKFLDECENIDPIVSHASSESSVNLHGDKIICESGAIIFDSVCVSHQPNVATNSCTINDKICQLEPVCHSEVNQNVNCANATALTNSVYPDIQLPKSELMCDYLQDCEHSDEESTFSQYSDEILDTKASDIAEQIRYAELLDEQSCDCIQYNISPKACVQTRCCRYHHAAKYCDIVKDGDYGIHFCRYCKWLFHPKVED